MRSYPIDSPEAATRLVAMAVLADGHYATSEAKALDRLNAPARLGLTPEAFKAVIDLFCEDLMVANHGEWVGSAAIDSATRRELFAEVQNPALGAEVRALCEAVMRCDNHLSEGERGMLHALNKAWPPASYTATAQPAPDVLAV